MANRNLSEWRQTFLESYVQPDDTTTSSNFLSGESAVLVSGPATLDGGIGATGLIPIGLVQNAQVSQGKQIQQLFEIGSKKPFFVPGRTQISGSMARILFDGASLFYALYKATDGNTATVPQPSEFSSGATDEVKNPTSPYPDDGTVNETGDNTTSTPGKFWSNLRSEIFNKPLGLGIILFDMEGDPYGGMYLEQTYIRSHNMSISAQQTILLESVSFVTSQIRPLSADLINT